MYTRLGLVTPTRIFKLQPFRNVKGDFCRTPSIGFNGHRYSNLFDGGSSSFDPSPFSLSVSLPHQLPATKTVTRNRRESPRVGAKGARGKRKRICISVVIFFSFSLLSFPRYSRESGTEATPADARMSYIITVRRRYFGQRFLHG